MIHGTDFFLPLREISHHSGIFPGRFPIPMGGIFPPCRNFSDHIPIPNSYSYSVSALTGAGPRVWAWSQIIQTKEAWVLYKSFNILCCISVLIRRRWTWRVGRRGSSSVCWTWWRRSSRSPGTGRTSGYITAFFSLWFYKMSFHNIKIILVKKG